MARQPHREGGRRLPRGAFLSLPLPPRAGWAVREAAERGYTLRLQETLWERAFKSEGFNRSQWSASQRDAYDDGAAAAQAGLESVPVARYRGRLRKLAVYWLLGWQGRYSLLLERDAAMRRAGELRRQLSLKEQEGAKPGAPGVPRDRPKSGAERQRAYRERKAATWITMPAEAHSNYRAASVREGTGLDRTVQSVLEKALRSLEGHDRQTAPREASNAPVPVADAAPATAAGPATSELPPAGQANAARKDSVQVEVSGRTRELLDELCCRLGRPRDIVLVHMAEALREGLVQGES
ncbi:hypothetical protein JYK14_06395 [Siccirubricoccus sp. KC 17139]|uniref:Uncharacterized protein n=1 Tax=Siccirubricoccus soli TaxID=2899147 RepID=A0ABT1D1L1_9PROT|nr:hypothetical protein [Siccirubricoccus soli]MCO6415806.1 hypothetical protein [Siccirubricoccus soli]MCP2681938.1 hypothetical protein [Siccirubricoccus soli]